jgi:hypothetical protein
MNGHFLRALAAVLAGNAVYLLLLPQLPEPVRHAPFQLGYGLVLDFALCWSAFVVLKAARKKVKR